MEASVLIAGIAAVLLMLGIALVVVLVTLTRGRRESRHALLVAQAETAELRSRLDELTATLERQAATMVHVDDPAYVITDAGAVLEPTVQDRVVLSATVGEPLVKAVAFGHGLRRALSAEARNKIWFEMRREVRRARK